MISNNKNYIPIKLIGRPQIVVSEGEIEEVFFLSIYCIIVLSAHRVPSDFLALGTKLANE